MGPLSAGAKKIVSALASRYAEKCLVKESVAFSYIKTWFVRSVAATVGQIARNCAPAIRKLDRILREED
jgi:hypothetical protein